MSPADAMELLEGYDLLLIVAGIAVLVAALLPRFLSDKPFTVPIAMVVFGFVVFRFVVFSLPLGLDTPDPIAQEPVTERLTELGVIISLMVGGLSIDRPPGWRS